MEAAPHTLDMFERLLAERTGQELTAARRWRIATVLAPLARAEGFATLDALAAAVAAGREDLAAAAVAALLNNETYFYRDRNLFDLLLGPGLERVAAARALEKRLSIWCAGCSTGQEVWSLAMHFAERASRWGDWKIDILGTDYSAEAIVQARAGLYSQFEVQRGLSVTQMMRWFTQQDPGSWRIDPGLNRYANFRQHNLVEAAPSPGRYDIVLCRNVLLYFPAPARTRVFGQLAHACAPHGLLMLGAAETVIGQTDAFAPDERCRGLYTPALAHTPARRAAS